MNLELETNTLDVKGKVLNCEVKDKTGLNDFQKLPDHDMTAIPKVGINRFRIPLNFLHRDGQTMNHDCLASMYVNLKAGKTGINMSRLCSILQGAGQESLVNTAFLRDVVDLFQVQLRDDDNEEIMERAFLKLSFNYPIKQKSLKSENWGWQYYKCELEATETKSYIKVNFEYSSTCPCSLSMAKQYEMQYQAGIIDEGTGVAAAHAQRSNACVKIEIKEDSIFQIEDLIDLIRLALPTETQSLVKRLDEQAFAILNGQNPMFVEHASKRLSKVLNSEKEILDWVANIEHYESLHSHNAAAVIYKGIKYGLREDSVF
jgi:GTP cyclohydrolase IB